MNDKTVVGVHWSFWAIGAVTLIWNVMGAINFFVQMNADTLASLRFVFKKEGNHSPFFMFNTTVPDKK